MAQPMEFLAFVVSLVVEKHERALAKASLQEACLTFESTPAQIGCPHPNPVEFCKSSTQTHELQLKEDMVRQ